MHGVRRSSLPVSKCRVSQQMTHQTIYHLIRFQLLQPVSDMAESNMLKLSSDRCWRPITREAKITGAAMCLDQVVNDVMHDVCGPLRQSTLATFIVRQCSRSNRVFHGTRSLLTLWAWFTFKKPRLCTMHGSTYENMPNSRHDYMCPSRLTAAVNLTMQLQCRLGLGIENIFSLLGKSV
jgi:hypothetical protein